MERLGAVLFADSFHLTADAERKIASAAGIVRLALDQREKFLAESGSADIIVAEYARVDEEILSRAGRLKGIVVYGVGVNHIDLDGASKRGVPVANSKGGNAQAVAELAVALMLECFRHVGRADGFVKAGTWSAADSAALPPWTNGRELKGKTLGVIGPGAIGGIVASIGEAFGMTPVVTSGRSGKHPKYPKLSLDDLLARSDVVSVNAPLLPETRGLLSRERLALMKRGAVLVVTSRGGIVDETAAADMLASGHLAAAGFDVFGEEPLPPGSPLLRAPNAVLTPHMGGSTEEAVENISEIVASCCVALLRGEIPETLVNGDLLRSNGFLR